MRSVFLFLFVLSAAVVVFSAPKNAETAAAPAKDEPELKPFLSEKELAIMKILKARRMAKKRKQQQKTTTPSPQSAVINQVADMDIAAPLRCSMEKCTSPFCQCIIAQPPHSMSMKTVPQMVLMVFHDTVNKDSLKVYRKLFPLTRRNSNGCPQKATIFVDSSNATDHCLVAKLWERGMEIALTGSTSSAQSKGQQFWQKASVEELTDTFIEWREELHKKSQIPKAEIRGWRTPFSQSGGDRQLTALREAKFLYDSTLSYRNPVKPLDTSKSNRSKSLFGDRDRHAFLRNQFYPFTFDYNPKVVSKAECTSWPCPGQTHPGLWEVPMTFLTDVEGELCRYVDNCQHQPEDEHELLMMMQTNLFRSYKRKGNRAPVMYSFSNKWHTKEYVIKAVEQFLDDMTQMSDVYVVTMTDAIRWMQLPLPVSKIHKLDTWHCDGRSAIKCRSKGSIELGLRSGSSGGVDGWDLAIPPFFGRFNRHIWQIEVVVLVVAYLILRYRDQD